MSRYDILHLLAYNYMLQFLYIMINENRTRILSVLGRALIYPSRHLAKCSTTIFRLANPYDSLTDELGFINFIPYKLIITHIP
jgi:hypothetical protein